LHALNFKGDAQFDELGILTYDKILDAFCRLDLIIFDEFDMPQHEPGGEKL